MKKTKLFLYTIALSSSILTQSMQQTIQEEGNKLFAAIKNNDSAQVAVLLQQSSDPKALANSYYEGAIAALREAVTRGNYEIVNSLIQAGAQIDPKDSYDITPLMMAVLQGHEAIIHLLIQKGANVNAQDQSRQSVLDYVCFGGKTTPEQKQRIINILEQAGARKLK